MAPSFRQRADSTYAATPRAPAVPSRTTHQRPRGQSVSVLARAVEGHGRTKKMLGRHGYLASGQPPGADPPWRLCPTFGCVPDSGAAAES
jgi:hypothetical protein